MGFLRSLVSGDESGVDWGNAGGSVALVVLFAMSLYGVIHDPSAWVQNYAANIIAFGTAAGGLVTLVGTGKRIRDGGDRRDEDDRRDDRGEHNQGNP